MSIKSIVNYSLLENGRRLDAEFYRPQLCNLVELLRRKRHATLGNQMIIRSGTTPSDRDDSLKAGIVLLKTIDIQNGILSIEKEYYRISPTIDERMAKTRVYANDVLINIVGATLDVIGRVSIVPSGFEQANITQAMALLRPKVNSQVNPEYLFSFLRSRYGIAQVHKIARPTGQFNLNLQELSGFVIPLYTDNLHNTIKKLVKKAEEIQASSCEYYSQAKNLQLSEIGLQNWNPSHTLTFARNYCQAMRARRIDAEYFQPKYDEAFEHIAQFSPKHLSRFGVQVVDVVIFDEGKKYCYIEIGDVDTTTGEVGFTERGVRDLPPNAKIKVEGGELIISKVRPTRGAIGVIPDDCRENGVCSSAFTVFSVPTPMREFVQVYLRSAVGKALLEKPCKGTSYPTIDDIDVKNLLIPTIEQSKIERISALVQQAHTARQEAKILLEKAKRAVEIAIEEDENKAMAILS